MLSYNNIQLCMYFMLLKYKRRNNVCYLFVYIILLLDWRSHLRFTCSHELILTNCNFTVCMCLFNLAFGLGPFGEHVLCIIFLPFCYSDKVSKNATTVRLNPHLVCTGTVFWIQIYPIATLYTTISWTDLSYV